MIFFQSFLIFQVFRYLCHFSTNFSSSLFKYCIFFQNIYANISPTSFLVIPYRNKLSFLLLINIFAHRTIVSFVLTIYSLRLSEDLLFKTFFPFNFICCSSIRIFSFFRPFSNLHLLLTSLASAQTILYEQLSGSPNLSF